MCTLQKNQAYVSRRYFQGYRVLHCSHHAGWFNCFEASALRSGCFFVQSKFGRISFLTDLTAPWSFCLLDLGFAYVFSPHKIYKLWCQDISLSLLQYFTFSTPLLYLRTGSDSYPFCRVTVNRWFVWLRGGLWRIGSWKVLSIKLFPCNGKRKKRSKRQAILLPNTVMLARTNTEPYSAACDNIIHVYTPEVEI